VSREIAAVRRGFLVTAPPQAGAEIAKCGQLSRSRADRAIWPAAGTLAVAGDLLAGRRPRRRDPAAGVARALGQEIVGRAINGGAESVEVGVQRGLLVDGAVDTADFGLSASNPLITALAVESIIAGR
jgi:hypothetical protein